MRYGVATWSIEGMAPEEKVRRLHGMGFTCASFCLPTGVFGAPGVMAAVTSASEELGMDVTLHSALGDTSEDGAWLEHLATATRFRQQHGGELVVTFDPAYAQRDGEALFDREATVARLGHAVACLGPLGVRVGVENWLIATQTTDFLAYRRAIGHHAFGMLLDIGHLKIALMQGLIQGMTASEFVAAMPLPIWEIHVHDNDGVRDRHWPCRDPELLRETLAAVRARGDDPWLTIEARPHGRSWSLDDPEDAAALRECLACLKHAAES